MQFYINKKKFTMKVCSILSSWKNKIQQLNYQFKQSMHAMHNSILLGDLQGWWIKLYMYLNVL